MKDHNHEVDWNDYAEKYDMLLEYNPFYQQLRLEVMEAVAQWPVGPEDLVVDVGAGTGNYSLLLARQFPTAKVLHIDNNRAMNKRARKKMEKNGLNNLFIYQQGIDEVQLPPASVKAMVSVHALYTFPDIPASLQKMAGWLEPGGFGILVDPGRIVNVIRWQIAIGWHLVRRYGISRTLQIFREAKPVSRQNRFIRNMQRQGKFWTHSPEEFSQAIKAAGFRIIDSRTCFRGLSDLAVVTR